MQQYISASGGTVSCEEQELGYYRCSVGGTDLALVALINGAAMAIEGAPDSYRQQQEQAQHGHRGIWGSAAPPG
jgi:endonuclease YncB( thermonuclease family)